MLIRRRLEKELARLERNKDRRIARDKQKGLHTDGATDSPISPASPAAAPGPKITGTLRKCANCGQVGHIKTNKKYAPFISQKSRCCSPTFEIRHHLVLLGTKR